MSWAVAWLQKGDKKQNKTKKDQKKKERKKERSADRKQCTEIKNLGAGIKNLWAHPAACFLGPCYPLEGQTSRMSFTLCLGSHRVLKRELGALWRTKEEDFETLTLPLHWPPRSLTLICTLVPTAYTPALSSRSSHLFHAPVYRARGAVGNTNRVQSSMKKLGSHWTRWSLSSFSPLNFRLSYWEAQSCPTCLLGSNRCVVV